MEMGFKDRVAIVAASSTGLGKAVAMGLAREGARLALCARTEGLLNATPNRSAVRPASKMLARAVDVTVRDASARFVGDNEAASAAWISAWLTPAAAIENLRRDTVQIGMRGESEFDERRLPGQGDVAADAGARWGRFIAITSVAVKQPVKGLILSNSVRAGVSGLIKTLSNEYGPLQRAGE